MYSLRNNAFAHPKKSLFSCNRPEITTSAVWPFAFLFFNFGQLFAFHFDAGKNV